MMSSLDLFSTSQTSRRSKKKPQGKKDKGVYDACLNNAPYFAYQIKGKTYGVTQGCCNDWNCPRCGQQRAREEYGRIVVGAREVSKTNQLYLFTITCRGREMSLEDAEHNYLAWTNRLLTRLRIESKRNNRSWIYAAVTERQGRGHPHSHYITTYCPADAAFIAKGLPKTFYTTGETFPAKHDTLQSERLERAVTECGLGNQYDISRVDSAEAISRYVAKYLFKASVFETVWPKGWRRVRYSNNWPKLPDQETSAFILLSRDDWKKLADMALIVKTSDDGTKEVVSANLRLADVIIQ